MQYAKIPGSLVLRSGLSLEDSNLYKSYMHAYKFIFIREDSLNKTFRNKRTNQEVISQLSKWLASFRHTLSKCSLATDHCLDSFQLRDNFGVSELLQNYVLLKVQILEKESGRLGLTDHPRPFSILISKLAHNFTFTTIIFCNESILLIYSNFWKSLSFA
jgi:hypothetical protein